MTTDTKTFTLINYRPNGKEYQGGGDYEHYNSEIGFERDLTLEQLQRRITEHTKRHRYESDSDCEFIVMRGDKPIVCRGASLWSFEEALEFDEDANQIVQMLDEARVLSQQEKADAEQAKRDAEAERTRKYFAEQERKRYFDAKQFVTDYEKKAGGKS
jgi:hypothetical protein